MVDTVEEMLPEGGGSTVVQGMKVWGQVDYVGVDVSRWIVVYPNYVDSTRKQVEGRRIAKEKAVERPNAGEIFECVRRLGLRTLLEMDKAYCRDSWVRGRVRVELFDSSQLPINPEISTRTCSDCFHPDLSTPFRCGCALPLT
jgi:signal recognition particle subunit SEC65